MTPGREAQIKFLHRAMVEDSDVRMIINACVRQSDEVSLEKLLANVPEMFDELFETIADMLDQSPTVKDPAFVRGKLPGGQ